MTRSGNLLFVAVAVVVAGGIAAGCAQTRAATTDQPARPITGTQTMPTYPAIARRLGEQGTTGLRLGVGTNGLITDCQITKSSGADRLDVAACEYLKGHWRYQPATHNGIPIVSDDRTEIVWDLNGVSKK